jgi:hypothetical protein
MMDWMRRRVGVKGRGALGALLNGADEVWHNSAVRARQELDWQHQRVSPAPSPGDRLLADGRVIVPASGQRGVSKSAVPGPHSGDGTEPYRQVDAHQP